MSVCPKRHRRIAITASLLLVAGCVSSRDTTDSEAGYADWLFDETSDIESASERLPPRFKPKTRSWCRRLVRCDTSWELILRRQVSSKAMVKRIRRLRELQREYALKEQFENWMHEAPEREADSDSR